MRPAQSTQTRVKHRKEALYPLVLMSFDEHLQHRIHPTLVPLALAFEPVKYIGVHTHGDGGFARWHTQGGLFEKILGQRWNVRSVNFIFLHRINPRQIRPGLFLHSIYARV